MREHWLSQHKRPEKITSHVKRIVIKDNIYVPKQTKNETKILDVFAPIIALFVALIVLLKFKEDSESPNSVYSSGMRI